DGLPRSFVTADFNHDGEQDYAVRFGFNDLQHQGGIGVFLGEPGGGLHFGQQLDLPTYYGGFAAGDFNDDGNDDLAVAFVDPNSYGLGLLYGDGQGHFAAPVRPAPEPRCPEKIAAADLTGDGRPELIVVDSCSGIPAVTQVIEVLTATGSGPYALASITPLL